MEIININCFEITVPDGGGMSSDHFAYVSTKKAADEIIASRSKMGGYAGDAYPFNKSFIIVDSLEELDAMKNEKKRQKALAKLSDEEKRLLGLI